VVVAALGQEALVLEPLAGRGSAQEHLDRTRMLAASGIRPGRGDHGDVAADRERGAELATLERLAGDELGLNRGGAP
jgi:hypothetical protein